MKIDWNYWARDDLIVFQVLHGHRSVCFRYGSNGRFGHCSGIEGVGAAFCYGFQGSGIPLSRHDISQSDSGTIGRKVNGPGRIFGKETVFPACRLHGSNEIRRDGEAISGHIYRRLKNLGPWQSPIPVVDILKAAHITWHSALSVSDCKCECELTNLASPPKIEPFTLPWYMSSKDAAGAVSRKSTTSWLPLGARTRAKPPPPIPLWYMPNRLSESQSFHVSNSAAPMTPTQRLVATSCQPISPYPPRIICKTWHWQRLQHCHQFS